MKAVYYEDNDPIPVPGYFLRPHAIDCIRPGVQLRPLPVGVPSGWEWSAAHDWDPDEGTESVVWWGGYLVNSELLNLEGGDWRVCDD